MKCAKSTLALILVIVLCFIAICPAMGAETAEDGAAMNEIVVETKPEVTVSEEMAEDSVAQEEFEDTTAQTEVNEPTGIIEQEIPVEQGAAFEGENKEQSPKTVSEDETTEDMEEVPSSKEDVEEFVETTESDESEEKREAKSDNAAGDTVAQAIWTKDNTTLTFHYGPLISVGDVFNGMTVTNVWSGTSVINTGDDIPEWNLIVKNTVTTIIFDNSFIEVRPTSTFSWFKDFEKLSSVTLSGINTSEVTNMSSMFASCKSLTTLDVGNFDTSNVIDMSKMFYMCSNLLTLNVSGFNTSKVTNMAAMFQTCKQLRSLNLSSFDTSSVIDMSSMFSYCSNLSSLDIAGLDTSNVENMRSMFSNCSTLSNLDVSSLNMSRVTNTRGMFQSCESIRSLDFTNVDTSSVTDMSSMFWGCNNLELTGLKTPNVINMYSMFYDCRNISSIDLSSFDTSKVTNMKNMFHYCLNLTSLDVSGFNTSSVTDMNGMFGWCEKLASLDVSGFDTSNVTDMDGMFQYCSNLRSLDVSNFDTSKVTTMQDLFNGCEKVERLDVSGFNTSKVTDMAFMFQYCETITTLDISSFDVSKVTSIYGMFKECRNLKTIYCADSTTNWTKQSGESSVFTLCTSLVGTDGDTQVVFINSVSFVSGAMAKSASLGGYFTPKPQSGNETSGTCGPNLTWTLDDEGTLTISGTGWMDDYDITSTNNLPPWFDHAAEIKKIIIEDGVTTIGAGAFTATCISRIIIPDSIVEIGEYAFFACKSLVSASIGTGVYYLKSYTFAECDTFTAVYFHKENKIEISLFAFEGCGDITGYYPAGCDEDWFISEADVFGAASFLWNSWQEGGELITFDQNEYNCEVGETIHISAYYESDSMVVMDAEVEEDDNTYFQNEFEWKHDTWYDGSFFCDITGKKIGRGKITLTCKTGIGQVSADVFINVVEPDGESSITEPFEAYRIDDTYRFHNLSDPIIGPNYYHQFFKPAQASILEKENLGTGGQCFGMVYSAVSTEKFYSPPVNSYSGATWLREVNKEQISSETGISASEYIKYAHLYQYTPIIVRKREMNRRSGPQGLYAAVANMNNGGKPVEIGVWHKGGNDGHSLLARGIKKNTENRTEILVYDCNYPLNRNCILTLYKTDGEFTSWEYVRSGYEYKSQNGAIIEFTMDYESFIAAFNGEKEDEASYSHLIMTPSIGTSISNQAGDEFSLYGDNDTNIEKLLPIQATEAEGETALGNLYWVNIGDTFTINAPSEKSHYEIAADYHTVELTLPGESAAELTVSDETESKVEISIPDTDEPYTVLFSETDDEGEQLNTYSISGTSGSIVSAQATDDGVIVSGNDLGTLEIITPETTTVYTVPKEDDGVVISESGNTKPIKLISEKTEVVVSDATYAYNGKEIKPSITVTDENNNLLMEGTDYTVTYENNIYPGSATVTIAGIGNYIGTKTETFIINPLDMPVLAGVAAGNNGITVKWSAVSGANKYCVLRKTENGDWEKLAVTTSTSYTDNKAVAGYKYTYTVRCVADDEQTYVSNYNAAGKVITYAAKPTLSSAQNQATGIKFTWKKAKGAVKYRVFKKTGSSGWKKLADTKSLSYLDKSVKSGTKYTYTVRCITSDGKVYTSGYNTTGKIIARAVRPTISSVSSPKAKQLTVKWKKVTGITGYQIQYSMSKSFASGNKIVTVKGATAVSKTIGSLKSKKKYYIRMRTYKTLSGKNYYSTWSTVKSVTVK